MKYASLIKLSIVYAFVLSTCSFRSAYAQVTTADALAGDPVAESLIQRRLLEFVPRIYVQPLISSSLIQSLAKPGPGATEVQKQAADKIAFGGASAVQIDMQRRMLGLSMRQQLLQRNGFQVGGIRSTTQAGGVSARAMLLQQQTQLVNDKHEKERAYRQYYLESRKEQLAYKLEKIKLLPTNGLHARSGFQINELLNAIKPTILEYGYGLGVNSAYETELRKLTISLDDISKIKLQLEAQGPPVIFTADKGSVDLGQLPFAMNRRELTPLIRDVESNIKKLEQLNGEELLSQSGELSNAIKKLEVTCDRVIGTIEECRQRSLSGSPEHKNDLRNWRAVQNYLAGLRGIVNRLYLESSSKFLSSSSKKYDIATNGEGAFPFVKFIVQNNCKVAPAANGDEAAYGRFLAVVKQMEEIINN